MPEKVGVKSTPSTRVDLNSNRIARIEGLDELAKVLFPGNKNHQRIFLAVFVELKWSEGQFLPALEPIADKDGISHRTLQTVRAKMRRLGIIDHVSRFNKRHGYREGWVFSKRFDPGLIRLSQMMAKARQASEPANEHKDKDLQRYI